MIISSLSNPLIKQIRGLRNRQVRRQKGFYFIEGIRIVTEAIQLKVKVETLVIAPDLLRSAFAQEIVAKSKEEGIPCLEVTAEVFNSLSEKEGPQGIGAVIQQRWEKLMDIHLSEERCWVALV